MRKYILIFCLALPNVSVMAQDYTPLIQDGVYWDVLQPTGSEPGICDYGSGKRHFFNSDSTLIDGNYYHILHNYNIVSLVPIPYCSPYAVDTTDSGLSDVLLREDVSERRVYRYNDQTDEEELLFDFSLEVGDTLMSPGYAAWAEVGHVVDSVSYLTFPDGSVRKQLCLAFHGGDESYCEVMYHIEGVGSSWGPYSFAGYLIGVWPHLLGVSQNDQLLFGQQLLSIVGIEEFEQAGYLLYPNPSNGKFTLELPSNTILSIDIYNALGQMIDDVSIYENRQDNLFEIDLRNEKNGVYILSTTSQDGVLRSTKIIKE